MLRCSRSSTALTLSFEALPADLRSMLVATTAFAGSFDRLGFRRCALRELSDAQATAVLTDLVNRSLVTGEPADGTNPVPAAARRLGVRRRIRDTPTRWTLRNGASSAGHSS